MMILSATAGKVVRSPEPKPVLVCVCVCMYLCVCINIWETLWQYSKNVYSLEKGLIYNNKKKDAIQCLLKLFQYSHANVMCLLGFAFFYLLLYVVRVRCTGKNTPRRTVPISEADIPYTKHKVCRWAQPHPLPPVAREARIGAGKWKTVSPQNLLQSVTHVTTVGVPGGCSGCSEPSPTSAHLPTRSISVLSRCDICCDFVFELSNSLLRWYGRGPGHQKKIDECVCVCRENGHSFMFVWFYFASATDKGLNGKGGNGRGKQAVEMKYMNRVIRDFALAARECLNVCLCVCECVSGE